MVKKNVEEMGRNENKKFQGTQPRPQSEGGNEKLVFQTSLMLRGGGGGGGGGGETRRGKWQIGEGGKVREGGRWVKVVCWCGRGAGKCKEAGDGRRRGDGCGGWCCKIDLKVDEKGRGELLDTAGKEAITTDTKILYSNGLLREPAERKKL